MSTRPMRKCKAQTTVRTVADRLSSRDLRRSPLLPLAAALALLERANGRAKLAIAMHTLGLDAESAQLKLDTVRGRLGDLLDKRGGAGR